MLNIAGKHASVVLITNKKSNRHLYSMTTAQREVDLKENKFIFCILNADWLVVNTRVMGKGAITAHRGCD